MGNEQQLTTTCLSSEPHDDNVKDYLRHYLGCLDYWERSTFFDKENELWAREVEHFKGQGTAEDKAKKASEDKRKKWERNCKKELSRIQFLRASLKKDDEDSHLVLSVTKSGQEWRKYEEYTSNIEAVKEWRRQKGKKNGLPEQDVAEAELRKSKAAARGEYKPEKDINVGFIQFQDSKPVNVSIDGDDISGTFPDQKIKIEKLLNEAKEDEEKEKNLLYKDRFPNSINYFHIPSNNMEWAEEGVARYFGQTRPDFHAIRRELQKDKKDETALVLKESHWRGQLHGGRTVAHSRFMRPFCEAISSSPTTIDHVPKNVVLFMPYLHWETSRQRERFAQVIDEITYDKKNKLQEQEQEAKKARIKEREGLRPREFKQTREDAKRASTNQQLDDLIQFMTRIWRRDEQPQPEPVANPAQTLPNPPAHTPSLGKFRQRGRILTMATAVQRIKQIQTQLPVDERRRVLANNPLGQYLIDAARLYEGMTNYRDKKLLQKFLSSDPPLHPRRTLDQAYYWTLSNTRPRDRDQVVYRATTAGAGAFHSFDQKKWEWECNKETTANRSCDECTSNIRKVSRVVMVDQLWMWILDAKTIITCFPKRYGVNKGDQSGVHKSIRMRVDQGRQNQVKSVFDLALIILDECSNIFFDRTKTSDNQPQVLEAFSEAIGNIMNKQTVAFERLWRWTDQARKIYHSRSDGDTKDLHVPLLDINPEGELEKEIKDIVEELGIMIYINKIHRDVLKQFVTQVDHILDPSGEAGKHNYSRPLTSRNVMFMRTGAKTEEEREKQEMDKAERQDTYDWFKINADELTAKVSDRIEQLEELQRSAENTAASVKDLLELKQQQASVVQAWQSVKQSDEAIKQGRSIMMFTVVTIIFLPLSFMTSIFGMNYFEQDGNHLTLYDEFKFIFPISTGVVVFALFFSLCTWARAAIWYLYIRCVTSFCVHTGLYQQYLDIGWPSTKLYKQAMETTDQLKRKEAERMLKQRRAKKEEANKDKEKAGKDGNGNGNGKGSTSTGLDANANGHVRDGITGMNGSARGAGVESAHSRLRWWHREDSEKQCDLEPGKM